ncbi:MAG: S1 RNA-binding domain-containing protein [Phycisphaerales bacterium]
MKQTEVNPWEPVPRSTCPAPSSWLPKVQPRQLRSAFVEIEPGIDGSSTSPDMSWTKKVTHPNELYKKGDEVECVVLDVDQEKYAVSLGVKQLTEDPWLEA